MLATPIQAEGPKAIKSIRIGEFEVATDYGDVAAEVRAVQTNVAVMDRSAWARVQLTGDDRLEFLQRMSTNDFSSLLPGEGRPTVFPDARGRVIDRSLVYGWEDEVLLVGSEGANKRLATWLRQYIFYRDKVAVTDLTSGTRMLTVYGPRAMEAVEAALGGPGEETHFLQENGFLASYTFAPVAKTETLVGATDPLGGGGVNLIVEPGRLPDLWERLVAMGATPLGYTAYERLRIEAGWPAYGREMTDAYNPLEAGLLSEVSFTKGCYIGQEVIARLDTYQKLKQHLMGLRFRDGIDIQPGAAIQMGGRTVGVVTSVSAEGESTIGLGYVRVSCAAPGALVDVTTPQGCVSAELVALPGRWTRPFGIEIGD